MHSPICVVTGASGFVGSRITAQLEAHGWQVHRWVRQPGQQAGASAFRLGDDVDPARLASAQALVHCAYDFGPRSWPDIHQINVAGSQQLLQAARAAGVRRILYISSLSAFDGCRSLYGRAKLAVEGAALELGADVLRPGLVWGESPGGVFGALDRQVRSSRFIPLLVGGRQTQFLVHEADLSHAILALASAQAPRVPEPVSLFHPQRLQMRDLLTALARSLGRKPIFLPVPWQLVWLGLRGLEAAGGRPRFRSDSLLGLVYQNQNAKPNIPKEWRISCRPFLPENS